MEMCKQGQHIEKQTVNTQGKLDLDHRKQNVFVERFACKQT